MKVGYIGYKPFVTEVGGRIEGPATVIRDALRREFGDDIAEHKCSWTDFSGQVDGENIDVIADPIFPSVSRSIQVLPYFELIVAVLVYPSKDSRQVDPKISAISGALSAYKRNEFKNVSDLADKIHEQLDTFPTVEGTNHLKRISTSRGVFESDLLQMLGISHRRRDSGDIVQDGIDALEAGDYVLTDLVSAKEIRERVGRGVKINSLFGADYPFWISAGCSVHVNRHVNSELKEFLMDRCADGSFYEPISQFERQLKIDRRPGIRQLTEPEPIRPWDYSPWHRFVTGLGLPEGQQTPEEVQREYRDLRSWLRNRVSVKPNRDIPSLRTWSWNATEQSDERLVFVLMPFRDELLPVLDAVRNAGRDNQLVVVRGDEGKGREILREIIRNISFARHVVVDLTGSNPNVCYELGLCDILGKQVVLLCQDPESLPFNLAQDRIIPYRLDDMDQLEADLDAAFSPEETED